MESIQSPVPAEQAQYCPSCGQAVSGSNFCSSCGHNMGFAADRTIADPELQAGPGPASGDRRGGGARTAVFAAAGALALAAAVVAFLVLHSTSHPAAARAVSPSYPQRVSRAVRPLVTANSRLSTALGALTASAGSRSVASRAASQAQTALNTTQGAVGALSAPASQQATSRDLQQALTAENGYLQAVTATLQTPSGSSAGQLQTLATGAQTALVALDGLIPTAGASISGASTLQSWAHDRATAASRHHAARTSTVAAGTTTAAGQTAAAAASEAAPDSGAGGASATSSVSCGDGLMAGPHTSCPFAENVQEAYDNAPGTDAEVTAYSPVTGESYEEQCAPSDDGGIECVGVGNPTVIFWN